MTDEFSGDSSEGLVVDIVADLSQFLKEYEDGLNEALRVAEQYETEITEALSLNNALRVAEKNLKQIAEKYNITLDQAAEKMDRTFAFGDQQVDYRDIGLARTEAYQANQLAVRGLTNELITLAEAEGFVMNEETLDRFQDFASQVLQVETGFEGVVDTVGAAATEFINLGKSQSIIEEQLQVIGDEMTELGISLPVDVVAELKEKYSELIEAGEELGLTQEQIRMAAIRATNVFINAKQEEIETQEKEAKVATIVKEVMDELTESLEKQGKAIPLDKWQGLQNQMEKAAKAGVELEQPIDEIKTSMRQLNEEGLRETNPLLEQFQGMLGGLAAKLAPVALLLGIYAKASQAIKQGIQFKLQDIEITSQLTLAVREHQRAMGELSPTMAETLGYAEELQRVYGLTDDAAKRVITRSLQLTRDLKLTTEQIKDLTGASVVLSKSFGIDATSALQTFTNFLNTGYTQGLQRLGFSLDEQTLRVEAIRRGYIGYGEELDKMTIKMLGLELITERSANAQEDVAATTDLFTERLADAQEQLDEGQEMIASIFIPVMVDLKEAWANFINLLGTRLDEVWPKVQNQISSMIGLADVAVNTLRRMVEVGGGKIWDRDFSAIWREEDQASFARHEERMGKWNTVTAAGFGEMADVSEEEMARIGDAADEMSDEVILALDQITPAINKFTSELEKEAIDIERDLQMRIEKLTDQFEKRRADMAYRLGNNLANIDRQANEQRYKRTQDYYETQERAKADHLIKMARMEEDYLWELEDGVRERDARAVLMTMRQYTRDRKRADEDENLRGKRRKEDFDQEMAEISRQQAIRKAAAMAAHAEEMERLAEEQRVREQELRDAAARELQLKDEEAKAELKIMASKIGEALNLNARQIEEMYKQLLLAYGPDGLYVSVIEGFYNWLAQIAASGGGNFYEDTDDRYDPSKYGSGGRSGFPAQMRQRGGTLFATSPTMLQVGETPERVDITPFSAATGEARAGHGKGGGRVGVDLNIELSEDLVVRVIDQTLDEMADVALNIQQKRGR